MESGETRKYLIDVTPGTDPNTGETTRVKKVLTIETTFSRDGGALGPCVFESVCYPFEDDHELCGGILSHAGTELAVVNDILGYLVDHGLIKGEPIILTPGELNRCRNSGDRDGH